MRLAVTLAAGCLALAAPQAAHAELYGLVVGVDTYTGTAPLQGAVNDATDVAEVLQRIGAKRVEFLANEIARRDAVLGAWESILGEAKQGDTVIFSFAGHGAQEPDQGVMDEPDGLDEVFLLQGFSENDDALFGDKIIDDELNEWATDAEAKGVNVIFVFDTCHSGIPVRSIDPRVAEEDEEYSGFRFTRYSTRPTPPAEVADPANLTQIDFGENIVALGATDESLRVREQRIEGKPRGVLSWAFSRAVEGAADFDDDGVITSDDLVNYVRRTVFDQARHRQIPQFFAPTRAVRLFSVEPDTPAGGEPETPAASAGDLTGDAGGSPAAGGTPAQTGIEPPAVTLFAPPGTAAGLAGIELVSSKAEAELIWDEATGDLIDAGGDILAFGVRPGNLALALKTQRLRRAISGLIAAGHALDVSLIPSDKLHCAGDELSVLGQSAELYHYTAFNVTGSGVIQFLWPLSEYKDPLENAPGEPWTFDTEVGEPYGSDAVVLIASDRPLDKLHAMLEFSADVLDPIDLWRLLENALKDARYEIAVQDIFTRDRATGSDQCG